MFEFLSHPLPAVVILLGVLVLVHELGHFLVGKACGVGVEVFSIGFGPRILGFRHNDTDYRLSWIPLGGYVKFAGALSSEDVPERFVGREMHKTSLWNKFFIIGAGPFANLVLAAVAYMILGMAGIKHPSSVIGEVRPGSPADIAGMMSGDRIAKIGDVDVLRWRDLQKSISTSPGKELVVVVERQGKMVSLNLVPEMVEQQDYLGRDIKSGRAGIGYGFLPPIVSVLSNTSEAARKGLKTGDTIKSVSFSGETYPVKTWSDILSKFRMAYDSGITTINLRWLVGSESVSLKTDPKIKTEVVAKIEKTADISTLNWAELRKNSGNIGNNALNRKLAATLYLTDAQLTISQAKGKLEKVLIKNDRILAMSGSSVRDIYHLQELLNKNKKSKINLLVNRNDKEQIIELDLKPVEVQKPAGLEIVYTLPVSFIGGSVEPEPFVEQYSNPMVALWYGVETTARQSGMLVATIWGLISGDVPLKALGGPMLIAKVAGDSAKLGWQAFLMTMALISINLGMINLFPIPVLDGGQLVIVGVEAVRRKRLSDTAIENYQKIGFVMVMSLVVLATYNDLSRFWASMVKGVAGLF